VCFDGGMTAWAGEFLTAPICLSVTGANLLAVDGHGPDFRSSSLSSGTTKYCERRRPPAGRTGVVLIPRRVPFLCRVPPRYTKRPPSWSCTLRCTSGYRAASKMVYASRASTRAGGGPTTNLRGTKLGRRYKRDAKHGHLAFARWRSAILQHGFEHGCSSPGAKLRDEGGAATSDRRRLPAPVLWARFCLRSALDARRRSNVKFSHSVLFETKTAIMRVRLFAPFASQGPSSARSMRPLFGRVQTKVGALSHSNKTRDELATGASFDHLVGAARRRVQGMVEGRSLFAAP